MINDIQITQIHARPDANGVVHSIWPDNISKSLAMALMHKQTSKQNSNGSGGGLPSKKNNPRRNRGAVIIMIITLPT